MTMAVCTSQNELEELKSKCNEYYQQGFEAIGTVISLKDIFDAEYKSSGDLKIRAAQDQKDSLINIQSKL